MFNKLIILISAAFILTFLGIGSVYKFVSDPSILNFYPILFCIVWFIVICIYSQRSSIVSYTNYIANLTIAPFILLPFFLVLFDLSFESYSWYRVGIPMFSYKSNVVRVEAIEQIGFAYRLAVASKYLAVSMLGLLFNHRKRSSIVLLMLLLGIQFLSGFRASFVDLLIVFILSYLSRHSAKINWNKIIGYIPSIVIVSISVTYTLLIITKSRIGIPSASNLDVLYTLYHRAFLLNTELNIPRVHDYVLNHSLFYGNTYILDFISIFSEKESFQQLVTYYSNPRSDMLFVMTPTFYGESYANWGALNFIGIIVWLLCLSSILNLLKSIKENVYNIILLPTVINVIYWFVRQVVTGGITNALITKILPILIISLGVNLLTWIYISSLSKK